MRKLIILSLSLLLACNAYGRTTQTGPQPLWTTVDESESGRPRIIVVTPDAVTFNAIGNIMSLDVITIASADSTFVPYLGANKNVDLGAYTLTATTLTDGTASITGGNFTGVDDITGTGEVTINESGADVDFRVETDANPNGLFVDAGADRVYIKDNGTSGADGTLNVIENGQCKIGAYTFSSTEAPRLTMYRSKSGTIGTRTDTIDGDILGDILWYGVDNTQAWEAGSKIRVTQVGAAGERMPTKMVLDASSSGTPSIAALEINGATGEIVVNNDSNNIDFRVESDTRTHALFLQGSDGFIGIGADTPSSLLTLKGSATAKIGFKDDACTADDENGYLWYVATNGGSGVEDIDLYLSSQIAGTIRNWIHGDADKSNGEEAELVINQDSIDMDFRVESDNETHALFVQGSDGNIGIAEALPLSKLEVYGTASDPSPDPASVGIFRINSSATNGLDIGADADSPYPVWLQAKTTNSGTGSARYPLSLNPQGGDVYINYEQGANSNIIFKTAGNADAFHIYSDATPANESLVINESGGDFDFRVESNNVTDAIKVDAGTDTVEINTPLIIGSTITIDSLIPHTNVSGITSRLVLGDTVGFGDVVVISRDALGTTANHLYLADADSTALMPGTFMTSGSGVTGDTVTVLHQGYATNTSWNWITGDILYVTTTATIGNTISQTAPSGSGDQVQSIGIAVSADTVLFQPNWVLVEIS